MPVFLVPLLLTVSSETRVAEPERSPHTLHTPHNKTMKNTLSTIFSRNNVMNALLALCTAIEMVYDLGNRFGTWYRNGGDQQIRNALTMTIAALLWTVETIRLGYAVVKRDGPQWLAQANTTRHQISRAFSYEYTAA